MENLEELRKDGAASPASDASEGASAAASVEASEPTSEEDLEWPFSGEDEDLEWPFSEATSEPLSELMHMGRLPEGVTFGSTLGRYVVEIFCKGVVPTGVGGKYKAPYGKMEPKTLNEIFAAFYATSNDIVETHMKVWGRTANYINFMGYDGVLKEGFIMVDYDDMKAFECRLRIAEARKECCIAYQTVHGGQFIFATNEDFDKTHFMTLLSLYPVDWKSGGKKRFSCITLPRDLKEGKGFGGFRKILYCRLNDENSLDEWPLIDRPLFNSKKESEEAANKFNFLGMRGGGGRNNALYSYLIPLKRAGLTYEEMKEVTGLINRYVFADPLLDEELESVTRQEAWDGINAAPTAGSRNSASGGKRASASGSKSPSASVSAQGRPARFDHAAFGDMFIEKYHIKKINGALHAYTDGGYRLGTHDYLLDSLMTKEYKKITLSQIREVYGYLLRCTVKAEADPYLHPFPNGVLDLRTGELKAFSPDLIATNPTPWDYNPSAIPSSLVDKFLDDISCGDSERKALLLEAAGNCFYHKNDTAKCFMLIGDKANGKSTYISLIQALLGAENYSTLNFHALGERFNTIRMTGKLANFGNETPATYMKDLSVFKDVVNGTTPVKCENKGEKPVFVTFYAKQFHAVNSRPRLNDPTGAAMRRIITIPFNAHFIEGSANFDSKIAEKLATRENMEYFTMLAVAAYRGVLERGGFTKSKAAEEMAADYEKENNPLLGFIDDCENSLTGPPAGRKDIYKVPGEEVYGWYTAYCRNNGFQVCSSVTFYKNMKDLGYPTLRKWHGTQYLAYFIKHK